MSRQKQTLSEPAPQIMIEMRCRACHTAVTVPLRLLATLPPRVVGAKEPLVERGAAVFTHILRAAGNAAVRYTLDHGVVVNTQDALKTTCYQSSFGCCGHSPSDGPNLLCRNGHLIGSLADDCTDRHFAHLSLQHCELFPLAPA